MSDSCTKTLRNVVLLAALAAPALSQMPAAPSDHGVPNPGTTALVSPAMSITFRGPNGKSANLYYNAPSARGRSIFGTVVPFGEVWRTGANPATTIVSNAPLKIGTLSVPAGVHTIYTLPAAAGKPWLFIVNNETAQWGTVYHPEKDLGRTPMTAATLPASQDLFSISADKMKAGAGELHIRWDKTDESVAIAFE